MFNNYGSNNLGSASLINKMREQLRLSGTGFQTAKQQWHDVPTNRNTSNKKEISEVERTTSSISKVLNWYETEMPGAQRFITCDQFEVNYNIYCDINRTPLAGENTVGLKVDVDWVRTPVVAKVFSDRLNSVVLENSIASAIANVAKDFSIIVRSCGFRKETMRDLPTEDIDKLLCVLNSGANGQNKITRLVKGFLIYRDLLLHEKKRTSFPFHPDTITYSANELVRMANKTNNAYVWCDAPSSSAYAASLYLMCQEYPNPNIKTYCEVEIPADGENIYLVSRGSCTLTKNVTLTPDIMWSSILKYCDLMSLGNILDEVAVIASSLSENRYHTTVGLPRVVSSVDLVFPATVQKNTIGYIQKPRLSIEAMKCIGRTHQLLSFVVLKDIIVSAYNTSAANSNPYQMMQSYLKVQSFNFTKYMDVSGITNLLHVSRRLDFLRHLSEDDVEATYGTTIFEGLWLVDKMNDAMCKGIIANMKQGTKDKMQGYSDLFNHQDHMSGLIKEMDLADLNYDGKDLSGGDWNINGTSLNSQSDKLQPLALYKRKVKYTKDSFENEHTKPVRHMPTRSRNPVIDLRLRNKTFGKNPPSRNNTSKITENVKVVDNKKKEVSIFELNYRNIAKTGKNLINKTDNNLYTISSDLEANKIKINLDYKKAVARDENRITMKEAIHILAEQKKRDDEKRKIEEETRLNLETIKAVFNLEETGKSIELGVVKNKIPEVKVEEIEEEWTAEKAPSIVQINEEEEDIDLITKPIKRKITHLVRGDMTGAPYLNVDNETTRFIIKNMHTLKKTDRIIDQFLNATMLKFKPTDDWFYVKVDKEDKEMVEKVDQVRIQMLNLRVEIDGNVLLNMKEQVVYNPRMYSGPFDKRLKGEYMRLRNNVKLLKLLELVDKDADEDDYGEISSSVDKNGADWRLMLLLSNLNKGASIDGTRKLGKILGKTKPSNCLKNMNLEDLIDKEDDFAKFHSAIKKKGVIKFKVHTSITKRSDDEWHNKDILLATVSLFAGRLCIKRDTMRKFLRVFDVGSYYGKLNDMGDVYG